MPIDDNPLDALQKQLDMEALSADPILRKVLKASTRLRFGPPFDQILAKIKDSLGAESQEHIKIMLETCIEEVKRLDREFRVFRDAASSTRPAEEPERIESLKELVLDAARKAENTRSQSRIQRIGLIMAKAVVAPGKSDGGDEFEEMMRVAMELSDREIALLRELVRIEGYLLASQSYIPRYTAHTQWESGRWGDRIDPELDSVFSKLESYGLVSRIPPPSNLNVTADFQNRYVLLKKGLRFSELISMTAAYP